MFAAALEIVIFFVIIWVFQVAHQAEMNIGICVGIWAIFPFIVAIWERVAFKVELTCSQFIGMLALLVMAVLISVSDSLKPS